jgi:ribosome maturation factor RimP
MTQRLPIGEETGRRLAAALAPLGLELCHVDWRSGAHRGVLTLTIDKDGGVSLDDCESASRAAAVVLDETDEIEKTYSLEVASPGLDRPLWTVADCVRFTGQRVNVRLKEKLEGTANFKGLLEKVDGDALTVLDEDRGRRYTVRFDDVKLARLVPELSREPGNVTERWKR